jgi:ribosomal protein S18 acetylase RimI-like enzyme
MIQIEPYTNVLRKDVFDFTERCFSELGKRFEPIGRHSFYNDIAGVFDVFYCALDGDKVIGTVALKKLGDHTAELKALYLDKDYRGQGLGSQLTKTVIDEAKKIGYKSIVLDSMKQYKEARKLYEKCGFIDCARYNDNIYADVFMKLEL